MMDVQESYARWVSLTQELGDIAYAMRTLDWDSKVNMPIKGIDVRARSHKALAAIFHEKRTSPEYVKLFNFLLDHPGLTRDQAQSVCTAYRDHIRRVRLPASFAAELAETQMKAYQSWLAAKKANNSSIFLPQLKKLIELKLKEVEYSGSNGNPYEYFTKHYEPGLSLAEITQLLTEVKSRLPELRKRVRPEFKQVDDRYFNQRYTNSRQFEYAKRLIEKLGFDKTRGRLDQSEHPFTNGMTRNDVRITTRVRDYDLRFTVWSTLHELGHAFYEQHLPSSEQYGLPGSLSASFGVHESQARFWENHIGRSLQFWQPQYKEWTKTFPNFQNLELREFYHLINLMKPYPIRTEADEINYHFHIVIRFEIEQELLNERISVHRITEYWNDLHQQYFNSIPNSDVEGFLQDMQWSQGQFGYFPSYSIGSFMAAQLAEHLSMTYPEYQADAGAGEPARLLQWFEHHIYRHGKLKLINELMIDATGKPLTVSPFLKYIENKYI